MIMRRSGGLVALVLLALAAQPARRAEAWNPLSAAKNALVDLGHGIGQVVGAPFGGLVEAATQPTIHNGEDVGHQLIADADAALAGQITHVGSVTSAIVAQVNAGVASDLDKVDHSMQARIVQVEGVIDDTLATTTGSVDHVVDHVDEVARKRIAQVDTTVQKALTSIKQTAKDTLAQADEIMKQRIGDVRELIASSIRQADRVAKQRIDQLDEVAGKRLGSIDVIATKQGIQLEGAMIRVTALLCALVFAAFVCWRLFSELGDEWRDKPVAAIVKVRRVVHHSVWRVLPQLAMAFAGAGLLYYSAGFLARDAATRAQTQRSDHEAAFDRATDTLDLADARFHEAQLEILEASETPRYRAQLAKAELMHTVFTRPAQLQSLEGINSIQQQAKQVERMLSAPDPELLVTEAFVLWQVGSTLDDEHEAATLCAQALTAHAAAPSPRFHLGALAKSYIQAYLYHPRSADDVASLRAALDVAVPDDPTSGFQHVIEYDRLAIELDRASSKAYLAMLSAEADLTRERAQHKSGPDSTAAAQPRAARTAAAHDVIAAWTAFDAALEASPALIDQPTALNAFTLNDAVLTHALYYLVKPEANELPPSLMATADKPAGKRAGAAAKPADGELTPALRVAIAPIRVGWEERYSSLIGIRGRDVLAFEESQRFASFEQQTAKFEAAYVGFLVAAGGGTADAAKLAPLAAAAAQCAADMGLYRDNGDGRVTEAAWIATAAHGPFDTATQRKVDTSYRRRHLRLL